MRLGFACAWDDPPERTWSHTPWRLREALREQVNLVDLGLQWARPARLGLKVLGAHLHEGHVGSHWKHHGATLAMAQRRLSRAEDRQRPDVVLQIGDLARLRTPTLHYQDASFDVLLERIDEHTGRALHFPGLDRDRIFRLRDRQRALYDASAGVLAMSRWFAEHLIRVSGVPAGRVHVVPPAANGLPWVQPRSRSGSRRRLLFVGKDFVTKGGELCVAATSILRAEVDPGIELTVVGPSVWPLQGPPPDGVTFLGRVPVEQMDEIYDRHDVLVLPSRFEGFGIAFVEALAHGLPCVGRNSFAMPEIITSGVNGALVDSDTTEAHVLAAAVAQVLGDDRIFEQVRDNWAVVSTRYSWSRVADDVTRIAEVVTR